MADNKRITLREIAHRADTSTMAVSVVLNGSRSNTRVSEATRRRILSIAEGLNYTPNAMAQGLKRQRTNTLGVLFNWAGSQSIHNLYSVAILDGVVAGAASAGYHILLYTEKWRSAQVSASAFSDQRTDGIIVVAPDERSDVVLGLVNLGLKVALVSSSTAVEGVPFLTIDNRAGVGLALDHLWDLGHRRIAYLGHGTNRHNLRERLEAYRDWMSERHLPTPDLELLANQRPNGEEDALRRCLGGPDRPTAILAFNDDLAVKALEVARGMGLALPADLSVVGIDDVLVASLTAPKLTTVRQPLFEMGRKAAELLIGRIEGTDTESFQPDHVLQPELIVRDSTAILRPTAGFEADSHPPSPSLASERGGVW